MINLNRTSNIAALALAATLVFPACAQQYPAPNQPQYQPADTENQDPPSRVARISIVQGNVSLEPAGVDAFSQAEINYPLTAGDRLYTDNSSMSELQTDSLAVRLGNGADLTLSSLTDQVAQFGLAQGSIRVRTRDLSDPEGTQAVVEIDTPNGTIVVTRPGDLRVDSYPQDDTTVVTVSSGQAEITGPNLDTTLNPGQSLRLAGTNPVYTQPLRLLPPDQLDQFDATREREHEQALAASAQYVDPGMVGVADLGQYGDWSPNPDYGNVWFPRAVPTGWTPYSNGHWAWVAPWGWTWVEAEPWGFAPFHYGRWAAFDTPGQAGRWGWVPGPPPQIFRGERPPRPVYSPALVAFVGGPRFSISVGFGAAAGTGVTAWFPLGPREPYQPWYHASPAYVNRVNVTNLYSRNVTEIHNTYINKTVNVYNTNVTNVTYVNRPVATVAVAQRDFASGHGVAESQHIRLDANTQRQLAQAPVLPHPLVTPQQGAAAPQAPARALPPNQARPVVETRQGFETAGQARAGDPTNRQPQTNQNQPGRPGQQPPMVHNQPVPAGRQPMEPQPQAPVVRSQPVQAPGASVSPQAPIVRGQPVQTPRQQTPADPAQPQRQQTPNQPVTPPTPAQNQQGSFRGNFPQQRDHTPLAPNQPPIVQSPAPPPAQPPRTFGGGASNRQPSPTPVVPAAIPARPSPTPPPPAAPTRPAQPEPSPQQYNLGRPSAARPQPAAGPIQPAAGPIQPAAGPIQRPADTPRPLINRTEPQPAQPSFPAQQKAIQATDPGRPLGPQQLQNLRQGKPAGPPTQPEPAAHPPAAATNPRRDRNQPNPNAPQ